MTHLQSVGSFRISLPQQSWTWSNDLFSIFGLDAASEPTTDLVLDHLHPDDRPDYERFLHAVTTTGRLNAVWHRVVTSDGHVKQMVTTAAGVTGPDDALELVIGHVVDVTEEVRVATSRDVDDALQQLSHSRPIIDQAKGALMLTYAIDDETAFAVLREYSQHLNVKVRDLARDLVTAAQRPSGWPAESLSLLDRLVRGLRDPASGENPGA